MKAVLAATAHKPLEFLEARQLVQMSEVDSALRDEARSDHLWLIQLRRFERDYPDAHGRQENMEVVPVRAHFLIIRQRTPMRRVRV